MGCGDDDKQFVPRIVNWIYDTIRKGRAYGAITGEMRDKTYEIKIKELENEVEGLKKQVLELTEKNTELKTDNRRLCNELVDREQQISTYERQFYKDSENGGGKEQ